MACTTGDCVGKTALPISNEPTTLCGSEVFKRFKDAVVSVSAIPKFAFQTRQDNTLTGVFYDQGTNTGPVSPSGTLALAVPLDYSGFFYEKDGYIVSSAAFLYLFVLALLYLAPNVNMSVAGGANPNLTPTPVSPPFPESDLANTQYTLLQVIKTIFDPTQPQSLVDFFDFFITVFNVNGCGKSYVYRGYVVGVDFETGIAIYRIDPCDPWNKCSVCIKKHPYLKFGTSKCYTPGNSAHVIATQSQQSPQSMVSGTIVNNTSVQANAVITYEGVLTDIQVLNGAEGAPILDQCGYVIGVVTGRGGVFQQGASPATLAAESATHLAASINAIATSSEGSAFGVSASFINGVVDRLIEADLRPACSSFVLYNDIFGFNIYRHATLGICYYYRQGSDIGLLAGEVVYPAYQERWYDPAYCEINRQLIGIVLKDNPTGALADAYEDCRALQFPIFQGKTVMQLPPDWVGFQVQALDLITGINGMPVGQLPTQITPSTLLYQLQPCDTVTIDFQKANEFYTHCHSLCTSLDDSLAWVFNLPNVYNTAGTAVVDIFVYQNLTTYASLVGWFLNSLSQVQISTILSLILSNDQTPNNLFGNAFSTGFLAGTLSLAYDPLNLLNNLNGTLFVPAVDVNVNFLSGVCAGAVQSLTSSLLTASAYPPPPPPPTWAFGYRIGDQATITVGNSAFVDLSSFTTSTGITLGSDLSSITLAVGYTYLINANVSLRSAISTSLNSAISVRNVVAGGSGVVLYNLTVIIDSQNANVNVNTSMSAPFTFIHTPTAANNIIAFNVAANPGSTTITIQEGTSVTITRLAL